MRLPRVVRSVEGLECLNALHGGPQYRYGRADRRLTDPARAVSVAVRNGALSSDPLLKAFGNFKGGR